MNVKLLRIELDELPDLDGAGEYNLDEGTGVAGGCAIFEVNGKEAMIVVHECGEITYEGPALSDEEQEALHVAFNSPRVQKAFVCTLR